MKTNYSYVLVLDQDSGNLHLLDRVLRQLKCPMQAVTSVDQVMATAAAKPPYLIILSGNQQNWSKQFVKKLRNIGSHANCITIVALTDSHAPRWMHQEENPGLDGFLVKPLNCDVLASVIQSAWARQEFCSHRTDRHTNIGKADYKAEHPFDSAITVKRTEAAW